MDNSLIIAIAGICGTLVAGILSIFTTYYFQNKIFDRDKKWSAEKDDRNRKLGIEDEQRKIRRELLSNRLAIVEESASIMAFIIDLQVDQEMGIPVYCDRDIILTKKKRNEEIYPHAHSIVQAIGSEELKKGFSSVSSAYWSNENQFSDPLLPGAKIVDEANKGIVEVVKIIDEMKVKASTIHQNNNDI